MAEVNLLQKRAIKRLMLDLQELEKFPVDNVTAAPLESNMFEWHCNFLCNDVLYHLILFFPNNYPYRSPSAEFVPPGFDYRGGATKAGKKGTQVCLSIFSDFAQWHTEWANEKNAGWSPGYTVQTVLLNMLSFLMELPSDCSYNSSLTKNFKCPDCGHTDKSPYPPLTKTAKGNKSSTSATNAHDIVCYASKEKLNPKAKPKSNEELYGYGLAVSGPKTRPSLTTPCEYISEESFASMERSLGVVHSIMKEPLEFFLPLYLHPNHGSAIQDQIEKTLLKIAAILPKCNPKKTPFSEMIIKVIPNLMSATVVEFSKGTQHASDNHLTGYFALHRLFLWALETYPDLQGLIEEKLKLVIEDDNERTKKRCPHIAERLILLSASSKYKWQDAAEAYLSESWRRNVMWYVKEDAQLGHLDTDKKYRLEETLKRTEVSRKILAFQVLFLDIAMPAGMSHSDLKRRYDDNFGFPTPEMVQQMKDACQRINSIKTYSDWFKVLKLKPWSEDEIFRKLLQAVHFAIQTNGYHWTFWKNAGGWPEVLKKYPKLKSSGKLKEILGDHIVKNAEKLAVESSTKNKGKQDNSKKVKSKEKAESDDEMEVEEEPKAGPVKGRGKGRGRGKVKQVSNEEEPSVGRRGKKRGASPAAPAKGRAAKRKR